MIRSGPTISHHRSTAHGSGRSWTLACDSCVIGPEQLEFPNDTSRCLTMTVASDDLPHFERGYPCKSIMMRKRCRAGRRSPTEK